MTTGSIKTATPRGLDSNAAEVVRPLELGEEARAVLTPTLTVQEYVTALVAAELFSEAASVLAAVLSGRDAVWWSCLCARSGGSLAPPEVKQVVPPPEGGTSRVAATAVILAGAEGEPEKTAERFQSFVTLGFEVARGRQGWGAPCSGSFVTAR
jgi:hypothetical protein